MLLMMRNAHLFLELWLFANLKLAQRPRQNKKGLVF